METNNLPRYQISIDSSHSEEEDDLGITQIAYTANPAIITKGVFFNDNVTKMTFKDDLKLRVAAPALIPDLPIYRFDEDMGEYEVIFSVETIEELRQDFMLNKGQVTFNLDHDPTLEPPSYILDSWITGDPETDPSFTEFGIKLPRGSWFVVSQFTDKDYFQTEIIDKDRAAYSIEGFLGLEFKSQINKQIKKEIMEEEKVTNLEEMLLPDGEHTIGDKIYVVENGIIIEIKDVEEEPVAEEVPVEEELVEDVVVEEEPVEEPVAEEVVSIDEEMVLAIIQPKLDELYAVIAELTTCLLYTSPSPRDS